MKITSISLRSKRIRKGPFTALSTAIVEGKNSDAMRKAGELVFVRGVDGFYYCTPKMVRQDDVTISTYFSMCNGLIWSLPQ